MTVKNAIKKLSKLGTVEHNGQQGWVHYKGWSVSFLSNGAWSETTNITCEKARRLDDHNDIQSDYSAGSFFDNLTQAVRFVKRYTDNI